MVMIEAVIKERAVTQAEEVQAVVGMRAAAETAPKSLDLVLRLRSVEVLLKAVCSSRRLRHHHRHHRRRWS